jgi:hypothetical protein
MDLLYTQAHQLAQGQLADAATPVVSDVKQVSARLGLCPAEWFWHAGDDDGEPDGLASQSRPIRTECVCRS